MNGCVRVKICGITSVEEARLSERCGADAVGVLVGRRHVSADFVTEDLAGEICLALPPFITSVLVTHVEEPDEVLRLSQIIPCHAVQLHSNLDGPVLEDLRRRLRPRKLIGKVSVTGMEAVDRARRIAPFVDAIVLDSIDPATDRVGGTGKVHDWSISRAIVKEAGIRVILAGGLTPGNVAEAIAAVRPWAVDVNSGVESSDGRKCPERLRRFIEAVTDTLRISD